MFQNYQLLAMAIDEWMDYFRTKVGSVFANFSLTTVCLIISVLFLCLTIITFIVVITSVETKSIRTFTKMYNYLTRHPEITKDNLVEFNKIMKARSVPASIRVQWQNYVVNQDKKPSYFLSEDRIVDKPLKSSKFKTTIKFFNFLSLLIAGIGFLLGLFYFWGDGRGVLDALFLSALSPMVILILTVIVNAIISYRYNTIVTYLYENVEQLGKLVDSACANMPEFVDYEILFTAKEIKKGIPVLQEFLRQRAKKEQEAIEKAKQSEVDSEKYNFEDLGVDGSLVMEKAMKESEHYLSNRRRYLAEIEQIESEKDLVLRNFDDKAKVSQRKLRDIKDNQQRLKEKLDLTTNKIMANELRKQQADEVKKQQAIEKEIDEDNEKHLLEIKKLDEEINKRKEEIEKSRKYVENVLKNEFKTYSDKIYNTLSDEVGENLSVQMVKFNKEKAELEQKITDNNNFVTERDALYQDKLDQIEQLSQLLAAKDNEIRELNDNITNAQQAINVKHKDRKDLIDALNIRNKQCQDLTDALSERDSVIKKQEEIIKDLNFAMEQEKHKFAELKSEKETEIHHYYDALGREFFYDINDRPYYYDETGKVVYYDEANMEHLIKLNKKNAEIQMAQSHNYVAQEKKPEEKVVIEEQKPLEEIKNESDKPQPVYIANESFFDDVKEEQQNQQAYDDFFSGVEEASQPVKTQVKELKNTPKQEEKVQEKPVVQKPVAASKPVQKAENPFAKLEVNPVKQQVKGQTSTTQKEPTLSLSERRAQKLQKMQEERNQKQAKIVAQKPIEAPKPAQKVVASEPELSLAERRAQKLQKMREEKNGAVAKSNVKTATKPSPNTVKKPAKAKEERQSQTVKKSAKKQPLSDAEVFEQAFKDMDMAAFNEKLSSVFEQIDAQSKTTKKKK